MMLMMMMTDGDAAIFLCNVASYPLEDDNNQSFLVPDCLSLFLISDRVVTLRN